MRSQGEPNEGHDNKITEKKDYEGLRYCNVKRTLLERNLPEDVR